MGIFYRYDAENTAELFCVACNRLLEKDPPTDPSPIPDAGNGADD